MEQKNEDISFVIISDIWLDQPMVLDKLKVLFSGYADAITPFMFILIGNFQSSPFVHCASQLKSYKGISSFTQDGFEYLANLIADYPVLAKNSHFVFVPGFNDPWSGNILPRPPIPTMFTKQLISKVKNCHFPGNPCRYILF
jgi:DNA polymerase epsilon subunit 2